METLQRLIRTARFAVGWEKTADPALSTAQIRCSAFSQRLQGHGVDSALADEAAIILAYKPLPWSEGDQAVVKRVFYAFSARLDSEGREISDFPGLWDESDSYVEPEEFSVPVPGDPDYET